METFVGFVLGIVASGVAAVVFDHMTSPKLEIVVDPHSRRHCASWCRNGLGGGITVPASGDN